jgi:hypothetical protein
MVLNTKNGVYRPEMILNTKIGLSGPQGENSILRIAIFRLREGARAGPEKGC